MRAFISSPERGCAVRSAYDAFHEAVALLAETQPAGSSWSDAVRSCDHPPVRIRNPRCNGRPLPIRSIRHWTPVQDVQAEAKAALARSLEAFTSLDDVWIADALASFQSIPPVFPDER